MYELPVPHVQGTAVIFPITPADVAPAGDDLKKIERAFNVDTILPGNDVPLAAFKRVEPPDVTDTPSPTVVEKRMNEMPERDIDRTTHVVCVSGSRR